MINNKKHIINTELEQITLPDSRYYKKGDEYYPSITYILSYYPKNKYFEDWLKKVGYSSEYLLQKAGEEGTQTHNLIENYLDGLEIRLLDDNSNAKYSIDVWKMFLKFVEFWNIYKPKILHTEITLLSEELKTAGTCDLICEIGNDLWVIDHKTSNSLHTAHEIQTDVYCECFEEMFGRKVDRRGLLWLKSSKRKLDIVKMQGKGWELFESKRSHNENIELFKNIRKIFDIENSKHSPNINSFPLKVKKPS